MVIINAFEYFIFALKLLGVEENMWESAFVVVTWGGQVLVLVEKLRLPFWVLGLLNKII